MFISVADIRYDFGGSPRRVYFYETDIVFVFESHRFIRLDLPGIGRPPDPSGSARENGPRISKSSVQGAATSHFDQNLPPTTTVSPKDLIRCG